MEIEIADDIICYYGDDEAKRGICLGDMQKAVDIYLRIAINCGQPLFMRKKAIKRLISIKGKNYLFENESYYEDTNGDYNNLLNDKMNDLSLRFVDMIRYRLNDTPELKIIMDLAKASLKRKCTPLFVATTLSRLFSNVYNCVPDLQTATIAIAERLQSVNTDKIFSETPAFFYSPLVPIEISGTKFEGPQLTQGQIEVLEGIAVMSNDHLNSTLNGQIKSESLGDTIISVREMMILVVMLTEIDERSNRFAKLMDTFIESELYTNKAGYSVLAQIVASQSAPEGRIYDFTNLRSVTSYSYVPCPIVLHDDFLIKMIDNALESVDENSVVILDVIRDMASFHCEDIAPTIPTKVLNRTTDTSIPEILRQDLLDFVLRCGDEDERTQANTQLLNLTTHDILYNVYEDKQNIHQVQITNESHIFLIDLFYEAFGMLKTLENDETSTDGIDDLTISDMNKTRVEALRKGLSDEETSKIDTAVRRITIDFATFEFKDSKRSVRLSANQLLAMIFHYITKHEDEEVRRRLIEELIDMSSTCSTGHFRRLCNVLSERGIQFTITWKDQVFSNVKARFWASIREGDLSFCSYIIENGFLPSDGIEEYDSYMGDLYRTLRSEFNECVSQSSFDTYFAHAKSALEKNILSTDST